MHWGGLRAWLCLALCLAAARVGAVETVVVQLNWKHQFEFAAFYAAERQGYYQARGLDVRLVEGGPGVDVVKEVVEGRADFGVGTSALVVDRARGQPVVALATMMQHSPLALLASRDMGVKSVLDLAGRPVSVDPHTRDEIEAFLRASGLSPEQIRLVDQADWTLDSLEAGKVAAEAVYLSNEPFLIRGREHQFLLLTPRSAGIDLFGNMLFSSRAAVAARPQVVAAFRDATLRGLVYALANPEALTDQILADYNTQGKSREHLLFEAAQIRELTRPDIVEAGYMSPGRWRHVVDVYVRQGKLPKEFELGDFLYDAQPSTRVPPWLVVALVASLVALLVALGVVAKVRGLNRALRGEMGEREAAEAALQTREAQYRELVENANALILRLSPDGTVTYFNECAERFFGYAATEIVGRSVIGTILPTRDEHSGRDLSEMLSAIITDPASGEHNENENITRDGRRVYVRWANRAIRRPDGSLAGLLCIGQDVTARRVMEQELAAHHSLLEEQVALRTMELAHAKEAAEAASRAKSVFLANTSHEIRTPLNGLLGLGRLAQQHDISEAQRRDYLNQMMDSAESLSGLISDILDLSKIEAGRLTLETQPFSLRELLASIRLAYLTLAQARALSFSVEIDPTLPAWVFGDPLRTRQILSNYLTNALKFTQTGGITVSVRALAVNARGSAGEWVHIEVRDTGPGIAPEQQARLFQPFTQADESTTRRFGGTGLGLSICRELATLMGGEVGVHSAPGKGSTFWAELPLPAAPAPAAHQPREPRAQGAGGDALQGLRVLIAEDHPVNMLIAVAQLEQWGMEVSQASDGRQAIEAVLAAASVGKPFDIVLMDVQMPVMGGHDATRELRKHFSADELPIIALTAAALVSERDDAFAAGMNDFLTKPIDTPKLHQTLLKLTGRTQA